MYFGIGLMHTKFSLVNYKRILEFFTGPNYNFLIMLVINFEFPILLEKVVIVELTYFS